MNDQDDCDKVDLRRRAEDRIQQQIACLPKLSPEEVCKLVHELEVHRIELQMQNEELRASQHLLEQSRDRFADLYDFSPLGYVTLDSVGLITEINLTAATLLELERRSLLGMRFGSFIVSEDRHLLTQHLAQCREATQQVTTELRLRGKKGRITPVEVRSIAVDTSEGGRWYRTAMIDISERKQAEAALQASEFRLRQAMQIGRCYPFEWNTITDEAIRTPECAEILGLTGQSVMHDSGRQFFQRVVPEDRDRFITVVHHLTPAAPTYTISYRLVRGGGSIAHLEETARGFFDQTGKLVRVLGTVVDATEKKTAEEQLRRQAEELEKILDITPAAIWLAHDPQCRKIVGNAYADRIMQAPRKGNVSASALPGEAAVSYKALRKGVQLKPDDMPAQVATTTGKPVLHDDIELHFPDGRITHLRSSAVPLFDEQGCVRGMVSAGVDISQLKQAEESLRHKQSLLDNVMRTTDVMLVLLDPYFNFIWVNSAYAETCRMTPEEMVGKNHFALYPDAENEAIFRKVRDSGEGVFYKDKPFLFPDQPERGVTYWDWSLTPVKDGDGTVTSLVFSLRETTHFKQAEESLLRSEERLALAASGAGIGMFEWNIRTGECLWNEQYARLLGLTTTTTTTTTTTLSLRYHYSDWAERVHAEDLPRVESEVRRCVSEHEPFEAEYRVVWPDGSEHWAVSRGVLQYDALEQPQRMLGIFMDITERKQAEQRLLESESQLTVDAARLARLNDASSRLWHLRDVHEGLDEILAAAIELLGADMGNVQILDSARKVLVIAVHRGFGEDFLKCFREVSVEDNAACGRALRSGQRVIVEDVEADPLLAPFRDVARAAGYRAVQSTPVIGRDGRLVGMLSTHFRSPHRPSEHVLCCLDLYIRQAADFIERCSVEQQLKALNETLEQRVKERTAEAQWRATQLQQLAAQMTQTEERERRRLSQVLHDGLQQVLVAAKLRLAGAGLAAKDGRVAAAIKDAFNLVDEAITESRSLTKELSPPVLYDGGLAAGLEWLGHETASKYQMPVIVKAAPEMEPDDMTTKVFVFQAARELILNAVKHAHPSSLTIHLSEAVGNQLRLSVEDDGTGFDTEIMNKREERGGFGLFSIRERLNVIGGQLTIASSPLEGTKATIIVPFRRSHEPKRRTRAVRKHPKSPSESYSPSTNRIRVLLADDYPALRKGLADSFAEHPNLQVIGEARDGYEAVEMALQMHPDVVLMDITMPRMDGIEATRQLKEAMPEICVIALSMHETGEMVAAMKNAGASEYLAKTAPTEEMIAAILRACPRK